MSPRRTPPENDIMPPNSKLALIAEKLSLGITALTRNVLFPTVMFSFKIAAVMGRNSLWFLASVGALLAKGISESLERLKARL